MKCSRIKASEKEDREKNKKTTDEQQRKPETVVGVHMLRSMKTKCTCTFQCGQQVAQRLWSRREGGMERKSKGERGAEGERDLLVSFVFLVD